MSYNETKVALRAEIKHLKGAEYNEAFKFFNPLLGEPYDIDGDEDECFYFYYEDKVGNFAPVQDYDSKRWGIDLILAKGDDYHTADTFSMSLSELKKKMSELTDKFNIPEEDIYIVSYTWYNGADEPIEFK